MAIRLTTTTRAVMEALLQGEPMWGYRLSDATNLGPGTVYPILKRLEAAGWVEGTWEVAMPVDRPRRCTYIVTDKGAREYAAALARRARATRRHPTIP